jgi:hypothetical protein
MSLKTTEFVTNNNMVIVPHPPYLLDLAPCDFTLFPKLKMKLNGRHFETVFDIQRESQAVLDSIRANDFHGAFEEWKNYGTTVYIPKETILKEMAAKIECVKPAFLFDLVWEHFDRRGFLCGLCSGYITRAVSCRIRENWN